MAHTTKDKPTTKRHTKPRETETTRVGGTPTQEEIRWRAYELSRERGGEPGHELEDWVRAERQLRDEE